MRRDRESEKTLRDMEKIQEDLLISQRRKLRHTRRKLKWTQDRMAKTSALWRKVMETNKKDKEEIALWTAECKEEILADSNSESK